jgi:hypothetical protein
MTILQTGHRPLRWVHRAVLALLPVATLFAACAPATDPASTFSTALTSAVADLPASGNLRIDSINTGAWQQLFVFAPYTPLTEIRKTIKTTPSMAIESVRLQERDDILLLVFMNQLTIQLAVAVPRAQLDLAVSKTPQPIERLKAVFKKNQAGALVLE